MSDMFKKKPHREPMELQLTAMIDIFSMLVIFLIFGTVIGATEFVFPGGIELPLSSSKESTEMAPQVTITKDQVIISVLNNKEVPVKSFLNGGENAEIEALSASLAKYVETATKQDKNVSTLLNVIADKGTQYNVLFDVVKVFKQSGFESILFITRDESGGNNVGK